MLQVLKLSSPRATRRVKEIHFPAVLGPSYVYASESAIHGAVNEFLGEARAPARRGVAEKVAQNSHGKNGKSKATEKPHNAKPKPPGSDGLVPAREAGESRGEAATRKVSAGFPVFYPTRLPSGAATSNNSYEHVSDPRVYHLRDTDNQRHGAYRMVAVELPDGIHYFGVQGIQGGRIRRSSTTRA